MMTTTMTKNELLADDAFCEKLVSRNGFAAAYWDIIRKKTARSEKFTYKEVFSLLNDIREERWGEELFPSYESFHMWLKRRSRPKRSTP